MLHMNRSSFPLLTKYENIDLLTHGPNFSPNSTTLREETLARSNFGEFGELPKTFAKFAKFSSRQI